MKSISRLLDMPYLNLDRIQKPWNNRNHFNYDQDSHRSWFYNALMELLSPEIGSVTSFEFKKSLTDSNDLFLSLFDEHSLEVEDFLLENAFIFSAIITEEKVSQFNRLPLMEKGEILNIPHYYKDRNIHTLWVFFQDLSVEKNFVLKNC